MFLVRRDRGSSELGRMLIRVRTARQQTNFFTEGLRFEECQRATAPAVWLLVQRLQQPAALRLRQFAIDESVKKAVFVGLHFHLTHVWRPGFYLLLTVFKVGSSCF